ncbi:alkene reductase [Streptomyces sp. NPDC051172]|uniref:oxidoreductase n=1 Tax=Streptomyces sp. NPDC051172 TaxID=3155796 RepID=UPI00342F61C9
MRSRGLVFAQLMHTGRIGHPSLPAGALVPAGPSAVAPQGQVYTKEGTKDLVTPKELSEAEIRQTVADFADAARRPHRGRFDGVELHGADGCFIARFPAPNANQCTDVWSGTTEGRIRFAVDVVTAVAEAIGGRRVGLRISPGNPYNGIVEDNRARSTRRCWIGLPVRTWPICTCWKVLTQTCRAPAPSLARHVRPQPVHAGRRHRPGRAGAHRDREHGPGGLLLTAPGQPGPAPAAAVGGPFNTPDPSGFYGGDHRGCTDHPTLTV